MSDITVDILASESATKVSLPASVFGCDVNVPLIHQVVVAQLAAARQGTHSTKTRGEVSGGGAKPWRQKGTGRARQGSRRAPQWAGGGTVHGPQPRSYAQRTPKKMIAAALRSALSERVADNKFFVMESIVTDVPSTRKALETLSSIGEYTSAVVVLHRDEDLAWLSLRNVVNVHAIAVDQINVYDVIANQVIVFTKQALEEFLARFGITELVEEAAPVKAAKKPKTVKAATPLEVEESEAPADQAVSDEAAEATAGEADKEYGEGSYRGANPPEGYDIKGKEGSMHFHTPASAWYKRTIADVWFNSAEAAQKAGFTDVMEGKK
ncbi:MAG: 50S ribosomal protein L4 [Propionibacteriaceae bacterium]|nr:50S ribosomal protein L4 [Propionibacteriaceae bacterium]